jgi:hypothetical protein
MPGFVKIYGTILYSSIWSESNATRLVWITMLALADRDGLVRSSTRGLAYAARVTDEECREALRVLSSPDPDSRSAEHEGRRIEVLEGGWVLLNYSAYRDMRTEDQIAAAEKKRRQRSMAKREGTCPGTRGCVPGHSAESEAEAEAEATAGAKAEREVVRSKNSSRAISQNKLDPEEIAEVAMRLGEVANEAIHKRFGSSAKEIDAQASGSRSTSASIIGASIPIQLAESSIRRQVGVCSRPPASLRYFWRGIQQDLSERSSSPARRIDDVSDRGALPISGVISTVSTGWRRDPTDR